MRIWVICLVVLTILLAACETPTPVEPEPIACPQDAIVCEDGTVLTRQGPNCEFPACPDPEFTLCDEQSRLAEMCISIYDPVCGYFDPERIQCITEPCAQTYSNSCVACQNKDVLFYAPGECPLPS